MDRSQGKAAAAGDRAAVEDGVEQPLKNLISRKETCALLKLSRSGVRKHEGVWLTSIPIGRLVYYPRAEVDRYIQARDSANAGPCFDAFNEGKSPNYVIAKLGIDPSIVDRYYKFFLQNRGQEQHVLVVELERHMRTPSWLRAMGFGEKPPHPRYVRMALEHAAMTPALHKRFMRVVDELAANDGHDTDAADTDTQDDE